MKEPAWMGRARSGWPHNTTLESNEIRDIKAGVDFRELVLGTHDVDRSGKVLCPAHDDHHPSLQVYADHAHCFACGWHADHITWLERVHKLSKAEAIRELKRRAGGVPTPTRKPLGGHRPHRRSKQHRELLSADRVARWERWWASARPDHPLLRCYLAARGLSIETPSTLRIGYVKGIPFMLARIEKVSGALCGLHRTFLAPDGSRRLDKRMASGSRIRGAAIRLYEPGSTLALAEGIETALAVHQMTGLPVWACVSSTVMENVVVPEMVSEVLICADHDEAGEKASRVLACRLLRDGVRVRTAFPPGAGDWLDELTGREQPDERHTA